jgi:hypothetical protein
VGKNNVEALGEDKHGMRKNASSIRSGLLAMAFLGDMTGALAAMLAAYFIRFPSGWITWGVRTEVIPLSDYAGLIGFGAATFLFLAYYFDLYEPDRLLRPRRTLLILFRTALWWLFFYLALSLIFKFQPPISRLYVLFAAVGTLVLVMEVAFVWAVEIQAAVPPAPAKASFCRIK